ncbi:MAG: hypothetical protein HOK81_06540 [Rhodospirillaceae bacterium]|jgi:hypothetical protein|nr:hypothetical protein [Rhodospirillaceae bacterium]
MTRTRERWSGLAAIGLSLAIALAVPGALAKGPPEHAKNKDKGRDKVAVETDNALPDADEVIVIDETGQGRVTRRGREVIGEIILDALGIEQDVVVEEDDGKKKSKDGLPPGLAKRRTLPPGLAKQVEETGSLPPGLQKRLTGDLDERFRGYDFGIDGKRLIVTDEKTGKVLDVIEDVLELGRVMTRNGR